ncbi:hypothetical protein J8F10_21595 [Gemmata sp. G18]|uniref:Alpha/beta hydrolase n=1 Tax=Gemmata palustris TaxID=2822762 RepID=A0ABS5BVU6_9BACT|nr:hypothetical protein [Gemmata palustris]MBP3957856.1 hypothetical protein [Gemmata palustris]
MATLLFVHGTGVRKNTYARSLAFVEKQVAAWLPGVRVATCLWGEECGAKLRSDGASVPNYRRTLAVDAVSNDDRELALWVLLYQDPLFELRAIATGSAASSGFMPNRQSPGADLADACRKVDPEEHPDLAAALVDLGFGELEFSTARTAILDAGACRECLAKVQATLEPQRTALARAIIARMVADSRDREEDAGCLNAEARDLAVKALADLLAPGHLGLGAWVGTQLLGLAAKVASYPIQRKRGALTNATFPAAGDVLRYQARGGEFHAYIRARLNEIQDDTIILAHSLGGIASFELLATEPFPNVKLLATVGSQAPFLYEIDALAGLRHGQSLPEFFPKWVNVYDPKDLLAYVGEGVFHGRVKDEEVYNRQPFPEAHSAYWSNPRTWKVVAEHWRAATGVP